MVKFLFQSDLNVFFAFTIAFDAFLGVHGHLTEGHRGEAHYHTWIVILVVKDKDKMLLIH